MGSRISHGIQQGSRSSLGSTGQPVDQDTPETAQEPPEPRATLPASMGVIGEKVDPDKGQLGLDESPAESCVSIVAVPVAHDWTDVKMPESYRLYSERWFLLVIVSLSEIANNCHWIAFGSVINSVARYYDQSGDVADMIPTISASVSAPFCLLAAYVTAKRGPKASLLIGTGLSSAGSLLCLGSSLPFWSSSFSSDVQFSAAVLGQILSGMGLPFLTCMPTKLSEHWFGESERTKVTVFLGTSDTLGLIMGTALTPLFVKSARDIPLMNAVWTVPMMLGAILTVWKVRSSYPPTPPSPSAFVQRTVATGSEAPSVLSGVVKMLKTPSALLMFLHFGSGMGYVTALSAKAEQILCTSGYSSQFAGLSAGLMWASVPMVALPLGYLVKPPMMATLCKWAVLPIFGAMGMVCYFFNTPDQAAGVVVTSLLAGGLLCGTWGLGLEMLMEIMYPIEETIGAALMELTMFLFATAMMFSENLVSARLGEEHISTQACISEDEFRAALAGGSAKSDLLPKDYSLYLIVLNVYMALTSLVFVVFFKGNMKRSSVDEQFHSKAANGSHLSSSDLESSATASVTSLAKSELN